MRIDCYHWYASFQGIIDDELMIDQLIAWRRDVITQYVVQYWLRTYTHHLFEQGTINMVTVVIFFVTSMMLCSL